MNNLVSIISPCYNNEKFIEQTIKSVLSQTYSNWEMLIVDDCSTDKSFETAKKYALQDSRIKVFKNDNNSGAAYSRNVALDKAKGKYVAFLDSDDLWEPEKLERQVMFMQENNCDFCFSQYRLIDEKGISLNKVAKVPAKINYFQLKHHDFIGCLTALYDFEKFGDIRGFDLKSNNDYGLFLQVVKKANNVMGIKEVLASYRIQHNGISRKKLKKIKPFFQ